MAIVLIVTHCFAFFCLVFRTEVRSTAFFTSECVLAHRHAQLEEIVNAARLFECLVGAVTCSRYTEIGFEFVIQSRQIGKRLLQPFARALHAAFIPNDLSKFAMEPIR